MKKLLYLFPLLLTYSLYAQETSCNCEQALKKLMTKVEAEYPGFSAKTKEPFLYDGLKEKLGAEARTADSTGCEKVLKEYTDFFKDPHLWVGKNGAPFTISGQGLKEKIDINIDDFQRKIYSTKDILEGVWSTDAYRIGLKKVGKDEYAGFIIEAKSSSWKPGDVKFKLFSDGSFVYALMDRSLKKGQFTLHDKHILFLSEVDVAFVRELPKPIASAAVIKSKLNELTGFYFKKLSAKTAILKLPSFEYQHLETINRLIEDNKSQFENSENLIIDVRGNPGGTTDAYQKLLPYISGKTIRNTGAEFLATETYINNLEAYKKSLDKGSPTENIDKNINKLKENFGEFVNFNATGEPVYREEVELAPKSPANIVILANKGTGSSAEYFLFVAKQSKKVKVLGSPSYGALDYGNAYLVDFGCPDYQVFMPTYRALRLPDYPIDNIGIQPDIYLDKSVKDWVEFALHYLE